jgi:hypothetical protein
MSRENPFRGQPLEIDDIEMMAIAAAGAAPDCGPLAGGDDD